MSPLCQYPRLDRQGRFIREGGEVVKCGEPATHQCSCCDEYACALHAASYFNAVPLQAAR